MPSIAHIPISGEYDVRVADCLRNYMILGKKQGKSGKVRSRNGQARRSIEIAEGY
jgi:hypothetical protein